MMKPISIMVAMEHKLNQEIWESLLKKDERFETIGSEDQPVLQVAKEKKPQIILLEMKFPIAKGLESLGQFVHHVPLSKVICISVKADGFFVKKMVRLGAKGHITQNVRYRDVITAIKAALQGKVYFCQETKDSIARELSDPRKMNTKLTVREQEVIHLVKEGCSSRQIADKLSIALKTVEVHRHHILTKLRLKNSVSLIHKLNQQGHL